MRGGRLIGAGGFTIPSAACGLAGASLGLSDPSGISSPWNESAAAFVVCPGLPGPSISRARAAITMSATMGAAKVGVSADCGDAEGCGQFSGHGGAGERGVGMTFTGPRGEEMALLSATVHGSSNRWVLHERKRECDVVWSGWTSGSKWNVDFSSEKNIKIGPLEGPPACMSVLDARETAKMTHFATTSG